MSFIRRPLASLCVVTLGLLALSGSGSIVGQSVLLMVLGGLMLASIIVALGRPSAYAVARHPPRTPARAASDVQDLIRMDSDKG